MKASSLSRTAILAVVFCLFSNGVFAADQPKIDAADTGFMIASTGLVLMMTLPGLALFYAGMVRKTNVLAMMAQSAAATVIVSIFCGSQPAIAWRSLEAMPGLAAWRARSCMG